MKSEKTKFFDKSSNPFVPPIDMHTDMQRQNNYFNQILIYVEQDTSGKFSLFCL